MAGFAIFHIKPLSSGKFDTTKLNQGLVVLVKKGESEWLVSEKTLFTKSDIRLRTEEDTSFTISEPQLCAK